MSVPAWNENMRLTYASSKRIGGERAMNSTGANGLSLGGALGCAMMMALYRAADLCTVDYSVG